MEEELKRYREKRSFEETPEPSGTSEFTRETNRFVIQKHNARREHYDLRLQVGNVLVSWAIPKKPVADTDIKRLAIKVEDHPLDYIHFEGTIPEGNYGAGTVMVWDIGYYYIDENGGFPSGEYMLRKIDKGHVKVYLQGVKLKGFYHLVKLKDSEKEDEWMFMKGKDPEKTSDIEETSALTGRSMDEIAASDSTWSSDGGGEKSKTAGSGEAVSTLKSVSARPAASAPVLAVKEKFPGFTEPMLATLTDGPFTRENWIFELKLDGYRIIGTKNKNETIIYSRRGNNYSDKYTSIVKELSSVNADFVIDGEVCFLEKNMFNFQKLQNFDNRQENLHYYVFDILWLNGHDLKRLTLTERKKLLKVLLSKSQEHIHYLDHIEKEGTAFFEKISKEGHEGVIAKKADSRYLPGIRTKDWLKMKTGFRQEMIICGFVPSDKQSRVFSSLVCCVYEGDFLIFTGRVGSGFTESILKSLMKKLEEIKVQGPPVANPPPEKNIVWVKPVLTCEVRFSSWTDERIMRHPVFLGLREDKDPEDVSIEKPVSKPAAVSRVEFSNPGKVFWPDEGLTKKDVIDYYRDISSVILPYLVDRPQSLYRTPNGIANKGFFQKNMKEIAPEWVKTISIESESRGEIEYMLCQDEDSLLYMANLGCIEINPWSSSLPALDNPDYMIFDLDPVEIDFRELVKIAVEFRKLFDKLELPAYCKTSGSRGMHIYIPVRREYSYEQVQNFVKILESYIYNRFPSVTSFERSPSQRKGKIYLDYLQNGKGKTMASVYSLRPRPGALVSAPVGWDELTPSLKPQNFTLRNMRKRLEKKGDLWAGMFDKRIDMKEVLKNLKL